MPEYGHPQPPPHFAVYYDRPISVSSLDRRRRREKLGRSDDRSKGGWGERYCRICPSANFRQTCTFQGFLSSGVSAFKRAASVAQSADAQQILQGMLLVELRMILPPRISPGPRNQNEYEICCGKRETDQEAPDTSSTSGAASQKPSRVVVRHFCDWLGAVTRASPKVPRHLSLRGFLA
jgi:hypothetical protein